MWPMWVAHLSTQDFLWCLGIARMVYFVIPFAALSSSRGYMFLGIIRFVYAKSTRHSIHASFHKAPVMPNAPTAKQE